MLSVSEDKFWNGSFGISRNCRSNSVNNLVALIKYKITFLVAHLTQVP